MATAASTRSPSPNARTSNEFQYRNGFGSRRSRLASFEHKENGIANRTRSPSPSGKGTRNFMAPTISAASKVIAASPKRKILADKNENLRSSTESMVFTKPSMNFSPNVPKDVEEFKNPKEAGEIQSSPLVLAADSSDLPPYDPNTNYLSPRPRFLHYRPTPRVAEHCLDEEAWFADMGDGKRLEDSFSSESCGESAETCEDEASSELQKSSGDEISSSDVVESGDENLVLGSEAVGESVKKGCFSRSKFVPLFAILAIVCFSVFLLNSPLISDSSVLKTRVSEVVGDYPVHAKDVANRLKEWSYSTFAGYIDSVVMQNEEYGPLFIANLSASMSEQTEVNEDIKMEQPVEEESFQEESFSDDEKFLELKLPVEMLETKPYKVEVTEDLRNSAVGEINEDNLEETESFLQLGLPVEVLEVERNAAVVTEDSAVGEIDEEIFEKNESLLESELPVEVSVSEVKQNEAVVVEDFRNVVHVVLDVDNSVIVPPTSNLEGDNEKVVEEQDAAGEIAQDETIPVSGAESQAGSSRDFTPEPEIVEVPEDNSNVNSETQLSDDGDRMSHPNDGLHDSSVDGDMASSEYVYSDSDRKPSSVLIIGVTIAALLLPAAGYFVYRSMKKRQAPMVANVVAEKIAEEAQEKETIPMSISGSSESYVLRKGSHFQNTQAVDMASFGSPSEFISSLQHSSSVGLEKATRSEMEEDSFSEERKTRRDSTVSSVSYGSFTTYEKRSAKKGTKTKDDEGLTPVRRSSRIRNKVASP